MQYHMARLASIAGPFAGPQIVLAMLHAEVTQRSLAHGILEIIWTLHHDMGSAE
jgi:hypothetical protein